MTTQDRKRFKKLMKNAMRTMRHMDNRRDHLAERAKMVSRIRELAEDGQIGLSRSGMDCDCVQYSGVTSIMPAVPMAVFREIEKIYEHADGPCSVGVVSPSTARATEYRSYDRALEAYENGHAHRITLGAF